MDNNLVIPFVSSTRSILKEMMNIKINEFSNPIPQKGPIKSYGVMSMISFVGKNKGRLIIDMEPLLAIKMTKNLTGEDYDDVKNKFVLLVVNELNNTLSGDANTRLNNMYSLSLRLLPAVVLTGDGVSVFTMMEDSVTFEIKTEYGDMKINIAFEGGV